MLYRRFENTGASGKKSGIKVVIKVVLEIVGLCKIVYLEVRRETECLAYITKDVCYCSSYDVCIDML